MRRGKLLHGKSLAVSIAGGQSWDCRTDASNP